MAIMLSGPVSIRFSRIMLSFVEILRLLDPIYPFLLSLIDRGHNRSRSFWVFSNRRYWC